MNAVCGILDRRGGEAEGLDAMLAALAGYGGASARWEGDAAGIGCRGPGGAGSAPPSLRFDAEAGVAVAADARLDDRGALCDALGVPRPERAGLADADLVLRAWLRWGRDCPKRLLGDYAFAVWDTRGRRLFCARDPVGVRPFYYAVTARGFVFASAVEAVLAAPGVSGALDEAMVAAHLTRLSVYGTAHTFFEAVRKLPPGHALTVEAEALGHGGALRPERYWRPEDAPLARAGPRRRPPERRAGHFRRRGPGGAGATPPGPPAAPRPELAAGPRRCAARAGSCAGVRTGRSGLRPGTSAGAPQVAGPGGPARLAKPKFPGSDKTQLIVRIWIFQLSEVPGTGNDSMRCAARR